MPRVIRHWWWVCHLAYQKKMDQRMTIFTFHHWFIYTIPVTETVMSIKFSILLFVHTFIVCSYVSCGLYRANSSMVQCKQKFQTVCLCWISALSKFCNFICYSLWLMPERRVWMKDTLLSNFTSFDLLCYPPHKYFVYKCFLASHFNIQ